MFKHHSKCSLILNVAYFSKQWGTFTRRSSSTNLHSPLAVKRLINHSVYVVWRLKPFLYYFTVVMYPGAFLKNIFYFIPIIFFCKTCIRLTLEKLSWLSPLILSPTVKKALSSWPGHPINNRTRHTSPLVE